MSVARGASWLKSVTSGDRFDGTCWARAVRATPSGLKKPLRVAVDLEPDLALAPGRGGEPFPQIGREIEATRGFDQQPEAMAAAHDGERRFRWSQHAHVVRRRRGGGEPARKEFGRPPLAPPDHHP